MNEKEPEFNLTEGREKIRKYLIDIGLSLEEARRVWELISNQDNEFIKRRNKIDKKIIIWVNQWDRYATEEILKLWIEGKNGAKEIKEEIDKLAGEKL